MIARNPLQPTAMIISPSDYVLTFAERDRSVPVLADESRRYAAHYYSDWKSVGPILGKTRFTAKTISQEAIDTTDRSANG